MMWSNSGIVYGLQWWVRIMLYPLFYFKTGSFGNIFFKLGYDVVMMSYFHNTVIFFYVWFSYPTQIHILMKYE